MNAKVKSWLQAASPSPSTTAEARDESDLPVPAAVDLLNHPHPHPNTLPGYRERGSEEERVLASWLAAVARVYRADPKRSMLITAATIAMLGLSARLVFQGPAPAAASLTDPSATKLTLIVPSAVPQQKTDPAELRQWLEVAKHAPRRDLFCSVKLGESRGRAVGFGGGGADVTDSSAKPTPVVTTVTTSQTAEKSGEDEDIWGQVAKSLAAQADQGRERQRPPAPGSNAGTAGR
jgi:hypothetical protein